MQRSTTILLSLALATVTFAAPAAVADEAPNADENPNADGDLDGDASIAFNPIPTAGHSAVTEVFIYDDGNPQHAAQAAENLAIPYTASDDSCDLADAATSGDYGTIVANIQVGFAADCDEDLYANLATFAEEPTNSLILQSWEIASCDASWAHCSVEDAEAVLSALGVAPEMTTTESPPLLQATETANACAAVPNPLVPTVDEIENTRDVLIIDAVGVQVADGIPCLTDEDGNAHLVASPNGAYMGFAPTNYDGADSSTLPGPGDMVKLFEDLIVTHL